MPRLVRALLAIAWRRARAFFISPLRRSSGAQERTEFGDLLTKSLRSRASSATSWPGCAKTAGNARRPKARRDDMGAIADGEPG
jgi:hypothetical protein